MTEDDIDELLLMLAKDGDKSQDYLVTCRDMALQLGYLRDIRNSLSKRIDLVGRRAQLASIILADDERALSAQKLEQIADVLFEAQSSDGNTALPIDPTQIPTNLLTQPNEREVRLVSCLRVSRALISTMLDVTRDLRATDSLVLGRAWEDAYAASSKEFTDLTTGHPSV